MTACDAFGSAVLLTSYLFRVLCCYLFSSHSLWVILTGRMPSLPSSEWADSSLPEARTGCHCLQPPWFSRSHVETPRWACAFRRTWDQKTGRKVQQVTCTDHPQVQDNCQRGWRLGPGLKWSETLTLEGIYLKCVFFCIGGELKSQGVPKASPVWCLFYRVGRVGSALGQVDGLDQKGLFRAWVYAWDTSPISAVK